MVRRLAVRRWLRPNSYAIAATLALGIGLSIALWWFARGWERSALEASLARQAQERAELLRSKMLRSMEALHSIAALYGTRGEMTRDEFRTFCGGALSRQPELFALGWSPRVPEARREAYEMAARREGLPGFEFSELDSAGKRRRAGERQEYFPVYYIEPGIRNGGAIGFDLDSSSPRGQTLRAARDSASATATPPMHLVQETGGQSGFVVYLPVYGGPHEAVEQRRRNLAGFASAVFRIDDLIDSAMTELTSIGYRVRVGEDTGRGQMIYGRAGAAQVADARGVATLDLAGVRWRLELQPTLAVAAQSRGQSRTILLAGIGLSLLLTGYLYSGLRRTELIERRVVQRTAQLSAQVAERKRAEEAARLAEAQYRGIFENASEGMFQTTLDGHYLRANLALARIYGYESPSELMSDLADIAFQLYVDPTRRDQFIQHVQRDGAISEFESKVYRRDGAVIWISENAHAVRDAAGTVMYYEGTVIDTTARKLAAEDQRRAHEELEDRVRARTGELALYNQALKAEVVVRKKAEAEAAAANRAKSTFLANMSHEIRTPMNAILGYAQILHRDRSLRDGQREAMQTILSSGNHLLALIDDILDLSKIEAGHMEVAEVDFDLERLIEETAAMFRHRCDQKGIALRMTTPGEPTAVRGDQGKLRQVLVNLVGNAVKFTDGGYVTLRAERVAEDEFAFEVTDTGPGIAPEAQAAVFDAFQQASAGIRRGGTGLGLAISRQYVELMGGTLSLESSAGAGSRFSFSLRLLRSDVSETPDAKDARERLAALAQCRGVRALVVDDVAENRLILAEILAGVGCTVETAESGEEALAQVAVGAFDVAFIDIMMPGVDGLETAKRMVARLGAGTMQLVATTASVFTHERRRYVEAGFDDVIAKPIRCERVYQCLADLLEARSACGEGPEMEEEQAMDEATIEGLPEELRTRLASAAELCSITDLKACVAEIEAGGPTLRALSLRLKRCIQAYDLPAVQRMFSKSEQAVEIGGGR